MNDDRFIDVQNAVFLRHVDKIGVDQAAVIACAVALGVETALAWQPEGEVLTAARTMGPLGPSSWAEVQLDIVLRYISEQRSWRLRHQDAAGEREFQSLREKVDNILAAWEGRNRGEER